MVAQSMWNIPEVGDVRSPASVMAEQGALLSSSTSRRLRGSTSVTGTSASLLTEFRVVAPALNDYSYLVALYRNRPTAMFPGTLTSEIAQVKTEVQSQDEFEHVFGKVLRSAQVTELVRTLLLQSSAVSQPSAGFRV
jgi:hypothetical protein